MTRYVVIKMGGHALEASSSLGAALNVLAADLRGLLDDGIEPVLVHGAGPHITQLLAERGVESSFVDGLRVTTDAVMEAVVTALGAVNAALVAGLTDREIPATGLSGAQDGLLLATLRGPQWGRAAGEIVANVDALRAVSERQLVGVVNPVGRDERGDLVNCNADAAAGAIAAALRAEALVLLSDIDQVRRDPNAPDTAMATLSRDEIRHMLIEGAIRDGMVPKVIAALEAVDAGAHRVVIANGSRPHAVGAVLAGRGPFTEVTA